MLARRFNMRVGGENDVGDEDEGDDDRWKPDEDAGVIMGLLKPLVGDDDDEVPPEVA